MIRSKVIPADEQAHYWSVVQTCLTEFHRLDPTTAASRIHTMREDVESMPRRQAELFFHAEPFDVACRIAEREIDLTPFLARYLEIRDRPTEE